MIVPSLKLPDVSKIDVDQAIPQLRLALAAQLLGDEKPGEWTFTVEENDGSYGAPCWGVPGEGHIAAAVAEGLRLRAPRRSPSTWGSSRSSERATATGDMPKGGCSIGGRRGGGMWLLAALGALFIARRREGARRRRPA